MNAFKMTAILLISVACLIATSCAGSKGPTVPDELWRMAADFTGNGRLFYGLGLQYNETDLAPLVVAGPTCPTGFQKGDPALVSGDHWAAAVTVQHEGDYWDILCAWLDDDTSPGSPPVPVRVVSLWSTRYYEILAAKVTACYFYNDEEEMEDESKIRVCVACMCREINGIDQHYDIAYVWSEWYQAVPGFQFPFTPWSINIPTVFHDAGEGQHDPNGSDDYCPDIACDPATGDMHVVWTNQYNVNPYYMLAYRRRQYPYDEDHLWSAQYPVYEADNNRPHQMWHPRIDVGDPDGYGDKVGVVYTAYSQQLDPYPGYYHVGLSFWDPGETDFPDGASYNHLQYAEDHHCGMPRLDIAPRRNAGRYCSIVFMNQESSGVYNVIETNNMRNDFLLVHFGDIDQGVYGAPVIHYGENVVTVTYLLDSVTEWQVYGTRFALNATAMSGNWAQIESDIYGDFAPTPSSAPGVEPGIVTKDDDNSYWAAWCNRIDDDATEVHAGYGDST